MPNDSEWKMACESERKINQNAKLVRMLNDSEFKMTQNSQLLRMQKDI